VSSGLEGIQVILLDIEGTTTPVAFVHERLFAHAREHLDRYLAGSFETPAVQAIVRQLTAEHDRDRGAADLPKWRDDSRNAERDSVAAYTRWLMDRDRKSPGLKSLQGLIWQAAYEAGDLHGEVFDDVPRAMARWRKAGLGVAIYSSGSELAQRLLFGSTQHGDLTPFITGFFDTAVGAKTAADSYRRIADALGCQPNGLLFISDVTAELAAAAEAGCQVRLCMRPGNAPSSDADRHARIRSFDEI
jgi:2,3-diketo-5-methylthio-1-phosphopentane phosphatase